MQRVRVVLPIVLLMSVKLKGAFWFHKKNKQTNKETIQKGKRKQYQQQQLEQARNAKGN